MKDILSNYLNELGAPTEFTNIVLEGYDIIYEANPNQSVASQAQVQEPSAVKKIRVPRAKTAEAPVQAPVQAPRVKKTKAPVAKKTSTAAVDNLKANTPMGSVPIPHPNEPIVAPPIAPPIAPTPNIEQPAPTNPQTRTPVAKAAKNIDPTELAKMKESVNSLSNIGDALPRGDLKNSLVSVMRTVQPISQALAKNQVKDANQIKESYDQLGAVANQLRQGMLSGAISPKKGFFGMGFGPQKVYEALQDIMTVFAHAYGNLGGGNVTQAQAGQGAQPGQPGQGGQAIDPQKFIAAIGRNVTNAQIGFTLSKNGKTITFPIQNGQVMFDPALLQQLE
jgi:hypothetical protein